MLNGAVYYHGALRKTIVAFGRLFSDVRIARQNNEGAVEQTVHVPIAYAPKEKWLVRIDSDPGLNQNQYTTLPRMSFEIVGYQYDATRKVAKMNQIMCKDTTNPSNPKARTAYAPAPYNIEMNLYALTKTQEDGMQIIEQILPVFNPEYTLSINAVPELEIVQDIPIILNSVSVTDDYDGDFMTRRFVTHTLNFTIKTNIFGPVSEGGVIMTSNANVSIPGQKYTAQASTIDGPVTENWEAQF